MLPELTLSSLKLSAQVFAENLSRTPIPDLFGITDGKAVGTYVETKFKRYLEDLFTFSQGNAATGIDLPELGVDLKTTSITQPQSSCPYKDASQKVYGLGYNLLIFVYSKGDQAATRTAHLDIKHVIFVDMEYTADYQTTKGIEEILNRNGNEDDILAFLEDRNLPLDEIGRLALAERIIKTPPKVGYLTISNALQWRLQYGRVITQAGKVKGVEELHV
jgi:hypothetical protein